MRGLARHLPLALTGLRAALAPVVALLAFRPDRWAFGACLTLAFLSDVFDGIVARRMGIATPTLRRLDSAADTLFYAAATFVAWRLRPSIFSHYAIGLVGLLSLEAVRLAFDWIRFRREASYHMWSSKLWGIALFVGFLALLAFDAPDAWMLPAIVVGIAADLEGLAISMVLPSWRSDVPTLLHALRLRRSLRR